MEQQTVKSMTNEQLIGACVWLDREQKKSRAMMNSYKAELQARGLAIMEDHNVKYVKFYGDEGSAAITDSMSLDILNPDKLKELVGEGVYKMKVKEETKTTYKFDSKFEKAMKAMEQYRMVIDYFDYLKLNGLWKLTGSRLMDAQRTEYTTKQAYSFGVEHTREFRVIWHEEHNLIFLDGTWSLDGSKIIDAWQKTEVL